MASMQETTLGFHYFILYWAPISGLQLTLFSPRSNGLVVRAVDCEARGPGFNSGSDQMVFSLLGYKEVGRNGSRHDKLHNLVHPCRK